MYGAAEEKSPGISRSSGLSRVGGPDGDRARRARHGHAGRLEQPLGVVAGRLRLARRSSRRLGLDPGEEDGRLHLGARDRQLVADRVQAVAVDHDRGVTVGRLDVAPISRSGSATRSSGRVESDSSPVSSKRPGCPATRPDRSRISVPALRQSIGLVGGLRSRARLPKMARSRRRSRRSRPSARIASAVASVSAERRSLRTSLSPFATAPTSSARCEIDLSPGTRRSRAPQRRALSSASFRRGRWPGGFRRLPPNGGASRPTRTVSRRAHGWDTETPVCAGSSQRGA